MVEEALQKLQDENKRLADQAAQHLNVINSLQKIADSSREMCKEFVDQVVNFKSNWKLAEQAYKEQTENVRVLNGELAALKSDHAQQLTSLDQQLNDATKRLEELEDEKKSHLARFRPSMVNAS